MAIVGSISHAVHDLPEQYASYSEVFVPLDKPVDFRLTFLGDPYRAVLDLPGTQVSSQTITVADGVINAVRTAQYTMEMARIVLDLTRDAMVRARASVQPVGVRIQVNRLTLNLYRRATGRIENMDLERYLVGVVAAEMPVGFHPEALKAQALAARSYTVFHLPRFGGIPCTQAAQADISDDPSECQAYLDPGQRAALWGAQSGALEAKVEAAVVSTLGKVIAYQGKAADAVYHSTCGGRTESAEAVWGTPVPYLAGIDDDGYCVASPYYRTRQTLGLGYLAEQAGATVFAISAFTPSGRTAQALLAGQTLAGTALQSRLKLPSTWITGVSGTLTLDMRGFGHGVGLCQYGADGRARAGQLADEIVRAYYTGSSLIDPWSASTTTAKPLIAIDPGHGGSDAGAIGPSGLREADVNLATAFHVRDELAAAGYPVLMTRTADTFVGLSERAQMANDHKAAIFVSLHCNAGTADAHGTETYHYPGSVPGTQLAALIQSELVAATGLSDRGVKEADFAVLRETSMPAALTEMAFISNPQEERLLADDTFRRQVARAIARASAADAG